MAPLPLLAQQRAAISCGTAGACRSGLLVYGAAPDHVCPSLVSGCEMRPSSRRPNVWSRCNLFAPCAAGHRWVAAGGRTLCYCERSATDKQRDDRQTLHGSHLQPPMFTPHSARRQLKTRMEDCLFQVNKKETRTGKRLPAVLLINWVSQCPLLEVKRTSIGHREMSAKTSSGHRYCTHVRLILGCWLTKIIFGDGRKADKP